MSLRARLLIAIGVIALAALAIADVITYSALQSFLYQRVDQQLSSVQGAYERAADRGISIPCFGGPGQPLPAMGPRGGEHGFHPDGGPSNALQSQAVQLRTASGALVTGFDCPAYVDGSAFTPAVPAQITGFQTASDGTRVAYFDTGSTQADGPTFRVRASTIANGDVLIIAQPLGDIGSTLHHLLFVEWLVTIGAVIVALAGGYWLVRIGLRPLRDMETAAESIAAGNLTERVPGENDRTEVGRLARTLNIMLSRIESAFGARVASEQRLLQSDARLRRFVADASHELRTPIAAISAYAELFGRGASEQKQDLERLMHGITNETARMEHLVADLLLLARLDEGRPLEVQSVDVVALCADAVHTAQTVGPGWPVTFTADRPLEVVGDPTSLRQVIDNLLGNVRAHTPEGTTAQVSVGLDGPAVSEGSEGTAGAAGAAGVAGAAGTAGSAGSAGAAGSDVVIEVTDTGPGMTPDQVSHVFERFYRSDPSRSRLQGGAGLGLSIVSAIVTAHGGTVSAASEPGRGTTFTVRLPRTADAGDAGDAGDASAPGSDSDVVGVGD